MELAPAKKHSACSSSLMSPRPAESRTRDAGSMIHPISGEGVGYAIPIDQVRRSIAQIRETG